MASANSSTESNNASLLSVDGASYRLVDIRATGDVLLDVTFENSPSAHVSACAAAEEPKTRQRRKPSTSTRCFYRVRLDTLKKTSTYFHHLLGSASFKEGSTIDAAFADLNIRDIKPSEAAASELPRVAIVDDDEASQATGREGVFEDLLRVLHSGEATCKPTVLYIASLAIMADRFGCVAAIARWLKGIKTFRWPTRAPRDGGEFAVEELLRQKILIAWFLDQPIRLAQCTKELILRGSSCWLNEEDSFSRKATWWDLPDSLEAEMLYRRECILKTLASVQNQFVRLYSSRERQCKLGYDSSAACDSFQLGEAVSFLTKHKLLHLTPFASTEYPDPYTDDIEKLINTLRQCPSYQIDQNHAHCGFRTMLLPALEYVQSMLSGSIGIHRQGWKVNRNESSWERGEVRPWKFTREMGDPRLRVEGNMVIERYGRALFTASDWDWSPEN